MQGEPRLDPHGAEGQAASDSRCLAARWESNIGWNYWRSRHGVDDMCCWYDVLERIGYRVSEDERKALKGAYLDGGDDES